MATIYTGLGGPMGYGEGSFRGSPLTSGNYDDGSIRVNIGSVFDEGGIDFFGTKYESIYINTNGLITFASAQTSYTPTSLAALNFPAIAAFWSDVNISSGSATGNNNIYWDLDPANDTVTITWLAVRPYSGTGSNTFQVQLTHTGDGNFEIEFLYQQIQWTNGFSGVAQTGFTDGGTIDYVLPGSGNTAALQQYPTTPLSPGDPNGIWTQHFWNGTPVCFTEGTLISTPSGPCAVENLRVGDLVDTLDDGPQPLRWVGGWRMLATGDRLPICIDAGALGNRHALRVSGQHLLLVSGADCELLFGEPEVLVAAKDLVGLPGITADTKPCSVVYHHLLLDRHQVLLANGAAAESLHPGPMAFDNLPAPLLAQMQSSFQPAELQRLAAQPAARRILRGSEAKVLRHARLRRAARLRGPVLLNLAA